MVERIERLEEEKKTIGDDIKDAYAEAKGNGFDTKVLRKVIALRKQDSQQREEQEAILVLYLQAIGMQADLSTSPFLLNQSQKVRHMRYKARTDRLLRHRAGQAPEEFALAEA